MIIRRIYYGLIAVARICKLVCVSISEYVTARRMVERGGGKVGFPSKIDRSSILEGKNAIGINSYYKGKMGLGSYIATNCWISADIGRFSCVANNVRTLCGSHPYREPFASVSPLFFSVHKPVGFSFTKEQLFEEMRYYDKEREIGVKIGNDCWIGENALIVGGVEIADGAVVLAGAVVTKNIPPYAIVGGVPAQVIGYRYEKESMEFLIKSRWWDNDFQWFVDNYRLMCDLGAFKESVLSNK